MPKEATSMNQSTEPVDTLKHLLHVLLATSRRPRVALLGAREFRLSSTTHFDDPEITSYDSGRELAHMLTLRRFEENR